jgi:hypothetical protein
MTERRFEQVISDPLVQAWIGGHRLGLAATMLLDGIPCSPVQRRAARVHIDESLSVIDRPSRGAWLAVYTLFTLCSSRFLR